jgi:toluene monooxygenase system ferredoxin subunit
MTWKTLCAIDAVEPGAMQMLSSDGTDFLVLRSSMGKPLVVPATCPHMTADLCDGFFDGETLTCTKHLWQWSVEDGAMRGIAEAPLLVYRSRSVDGVLQIEFEHELRYSHEA